MCVCVCVCVQPQPCEIQSIMSALDEDNTGYVGFTVNTHTHTHTHTHAHTHTQTHKHARKHDSNFSQQTVQNVLTAGVKLRTLL